MSIDNWIHFLVALIAITNPIGNLAIFIGLTSNETLREQHKAALVTGASVFIILLITTWVGSGLLKFFGISVPAFQLAGGLIITLLGLSMLQSKPHSMSYSKAEHEQAKTKESVAIVPMSIPIIAGPGAISTIIANSHKFGGFMGGVDSSIAVIIVSLIILITLYFASPISKFFGSSGIKIATRVMGLILVAMAMQMIADGLTTLFPAWT